MYFGSSIDFEALFGSNEDPCRFRDEYIRVTAAVKC